MGYGTRPRPVPPFHVLIGFVTDRHWSVRLPGFEQWLADHPDRTLALECARVTGFEPRALTALADLIRSSDRRVRLLNWRTEFVTAVFSQLLIDRLEGTAPGAPRAAASGADRGAALVTLADRLEALEADLTRLRTQLEGLRDVRPGW